jgi:hypothetical protein
MLAAMMDRGWRCPKCARSFRHTNQRHACGTGEHEDVVRNRPESVVRTYAALAAVVKGLSGVEMMTRDRSVLLRTSRIFADLVVMTSAVRIAIHLGRRLDDAIFFKVVSDRKRVTHVAKLTMAEDVALIAPYLKEAYELSLSE